MKSYSSRYPRCFWLICLLAFGQHLATAVHICPAFTKCYCFFNKEIDCLQFDLKTIPHFDPENITFDLIDLGQNRFGEVGANAFKNLRVKQITLWENRKNLTIHRDAFEGLGDYLEYLELAKNREITSIPSGLFRHLSKLEVVDMQKNHLKYLPSFAFKGASSLEFIDLQRNDISFIRDHTFRGLVSLKRLLLSENNISAMGAKAFLGMKKLEELYLDRNMIRDLQPKSFRRLDMLRILDLSHNVIPALFPIMFKGLRKLEILDLASNPLQLIADNTFSSMEALTKLTIDKSKLSYLNPGMFRGLKNLRELSLTKNNIYTLQDDLFKSLPNLWKFNIEHNQLSTVNPCAFLDITTMKAIYANGNPIHCDCTMSWSVEDSSPEVLGKCATPESEKKSDIMSEARFRVCTHSGMECRKSQQTIDGNDSLRLWLRYRRAYRHAPSRNLGQ